MAVLPLYASLSPWASEAWGKQVLPELPGSGPKAPALLVILTKGSVLTLASFLEGIPGPAGLGIPVQVVLSPGPWRARAQTPLLGLVLLPTLEN